MALALGTEMRLELRPTAALVAYAQLLATGASELERLVERELRENPALERAEPVPGALPAAAPPEPADEPGTLARLALDARLSLPARDHIVLELVLGSLDSHGFLTVEPAAIARATGAPLSRVDSIVALVRELGLVGIACRGVRECLDAQLVRLDADPRLVALARRLVVEGLEDLAAGRYGALARRLGVDRAAVVAARDLVRARLRPFPVIESGHAEPAPVPEIVIGLHGGRVLVELTEERCCALRVSPGSATLDAADARRAQAFLRRLGERWATIRRVVEALAYEQRSFLVDGPAALRPLTRAQLAASLGLHESTVSRAVAGRSALLPCGRVVELSAFFTAALSAQEALRQIVAREPRPLCDDELAAALAASGHPVARRTVAKYRGLLGIPPSAQRTGEARFASGAPAAKAASPPGARAG